MNASIKLFAILALACFAIHGADKPAEPQGPQTVKFRVMGLFSPDREVDLRDACKDFPEDVKLTGIDFANSEATFTYEAQGKTMKGAKPEQIQQRLDNMIKNASHHTLGVHPAFATPREKLQNIEIKIAGLDCKACAWATYRIISGVDGVERATVNFKDGIATARIDPDKTNKGALVEVLRKREVGVKEELPKQDEKK